MQSKAKTAAEYLAELPDDRRGAISAIRRVILDNIDKGFEEGMQYGMISYHVPHSIFPAGYHCDPKQPLGYLGLASQKQYMSLYVPLYIGPGAGALRMWFEQAWTKTGRKLDMGKCCVRFKRLEDVPLEVVAEMLRRLPLKAYVAMYEASLAAHTPTPRAKIREMVAKRKAAKAGAKKKVTKAAISKKKTKKKATKRP